jgi:hypothetical protein
MESEFKAQTKFEAEFDESGNLLGYSRIETAREFYVSLNLAAILTGRDRATVTRASRELESFDGAKGLEAIPIPPLDGPGRERRSIEFSRRR